MVDPITLEVVKGGLIYAAEEMGIALRKSAYSPNIKERMDHSCALFNPRAELVAQAEHIPVHLGSMSLGVRQGLEEYAGELGEGDVLLLNDPYISGTHLPDQTMIAPVYHRGELVGYTANKAHHTDVGGKAPGSLAADSTELIQEGLIIPPVKFVKGGRVDGELARLIKSNVRTPKVQMGDLRAQVAAVNLGARRLCELVEQFGLETVHRCMELMLDQSEAQMRRAISQAPDGEYVGLDYLEAIPPEGRDAEIRVKVVKQGETLLFDYTGTSPQVDAPYNAPLGVTVSGIYFTLISVFAKGIAVNDGCFRPVSLVVPEGCLLNPRRPAPVAGGNVETSQRNVDVLMRAFAQMLPGRIPAASQGTMNNVAVGGVHNGVPWTFYETIGGGSGGRPNGDGVDGIHVNMTNTMNTPIEAIEAYLPIEFKAYRLRPDSGGAGRFRGGCGIERVWTLVGESATLSIMAERTKNRPWGLEGGKPGAPGEFTLVKASGERITLPPKCTINMERGDTLIIRTPGGGGFGDPSERETWRVEEDMLDGLVSPEAARRDYGYTPKEYKQRR